MTLTEVQFCKLCLTPNTRPRVVFDKNQICNACLNAKEKRSINWDSRLNEFKKLVGSIKEQKTSGYDCIVPFSGGKDSSTIAYKLKFNFGLNPLLVTYSPMIPNEIGIHNRKEMINLGFDNLMIQPNQKVLRHLSKRFFIERGNPKVAWDAAINSVPIQAAVNYKINTVFYAEHGESEYGGRVLKEESKRTKDFTEVIENHVGDDPSNWVDDIVSENDLIQYIYPESNIIKTLGIKAYYFSYFFKWSMYENYNFIKEKINFRTNQKGRTDGTFTNYDSLDDKIDGLYYYMQFIKFGFGRAIRDGSRLIQNGHMSRKEAFLLAKKYDDEFCYEHFNEVLDYLDLNRNEFNEIVDMHRNKEIWNYSSGNWTLNYKIS